MLLPTMRLLISYFCGGAIYLSDVHPIAHDTREVDFKDINVIVWLIEEAEVPYNFRRILSNEIKQYHYCLSSYPIDKRLRLYDSVFNAIYYAVDKGKNVVIISRNEMDRVSVLISFFIHCLRWGERFLKYDFLNDIPKTYSNWTDSFLYYIRLMCPDANLDYDIHTSLRTLEDKVIEEMREN